MISFLLPYFRKYGWWYSFGTVLLLFTHFLSSWIPRQIQEVIDLFSHDWSTHVFNDHIIHIFTASAALIISRTLSRVVMFFPARFIERDLRQNFFEKLLKLPVVYFEEKKTGDLISICQNDIQNVRLMCGFAFMHLLNTVGLYSFIIYQMISLNGRLTLILFLPFPFLIMACRGLVKKFHTLSALTQTQLGSLTEFIIEILKGITVIKCFGAKYTLLEKFDEENQLFLNLQNQSAMVRSIMFPLMAVMAGLSTCILFGYGGYLMMNGNLTVGEFTAFSSYLYLLAWPTAALSWIINVIQRGMNSLNRLQDVLSEPEETDELTEMKKEILEEVREIEVRQLNVSISPEFELKDIHFSLQKGKWVGVFGMIGSGKSLLAKYVSGMRDVPNGCLFVNGAEMHQFNLDSYRACLSYVPQEAFLFSDTIRENIGYARPDLDVLEDQDIIEANKRACFHEEVLKFNEQYQTLIGEKGIYLSGGQKKRTTLARALFKRHDMLILDDVFSAVDNKTEKLLIDELLQYKGKKGALIISHRLSALKHCDEVIILDKGRMVYKGTFEDCLLHSEHFRESQHIQGNRDEARS